MRLIKQYGIWLALGLTVMATIWVGQQEDAASDEVLSVQVKGDGADSTLNHVSSTSSIQSFLDDSVYQRDVIRDQPLNLFATTVVPQEQLSDEEVNVEPQIPVNPFTYAGKLLEDGSLVVFLTDGTRNYSVKSGDILNGIWKVQDIHPQELILQYIPLKIEIQMQIGALS